MSAFHVRVVSNHPQRLWITLWTEFRHRRQVALRKGFSFFRSNFERHVFRHGDQGLMKYSPLVAGLRAREAPGPPLRQGAGG